MLDKPQFQWKLSLCLHPYIFPILFHKLAIWQENQYYIYSTNKHIHVYLQIITPFYDKENFPNIRLKALKYFEGIAK